MNKNQLLHLAKRQRIELPQIAHTQTYESALRWSKLLWDLNPVAPQADQVEQRLAQLTEWAQLGSVPALSLLEGLNTIWEERNTSKISAWLSGVLGWRLVKESDLLEAPDSNHALPASINEEGCCLYVFQLDGRSARPFRHLENVRNEWLTCWVEKTSGLIGISFVCDQVVETRDNITQSISCFVPLDLIDTWKEAIEQLNAPPESLQELCLQLRTPRGSKFAWLGVYLDKLREVQQRNFLNGDELSRVRAEVAKTFIDTFSSTSLIQLQEQVREASRQGHRMLSDAAEPQFLMKEVVPFQEMVITSRARGFNRLCAPILQEASHQVSLRTKAGDPFIVHESRWFGKAAAQLINSRSRS